MNHLGEIVEAAVNAATLDDARRVQELIARKIGGRHKRPLFDTVNNYGAVTAAGIIRRKSIELATNMQDTVIEREALRRSATRNPCLTSLRRRPLRRSSPAYVRRSS